MKKLFTLFSVIMMLAVTGTLLAQSVTLKMKRPPLNQLKAADLWSATITNSGEPFTAYLYGSMTNNENSELIATGQTMTFEVRTGTTNFKVSDLPRVPDINYLSKDPKYKQSFMNTGGAPPGDYKICVELRYTNNSVVGEDCFDQRITGGDAPQLISPRDEEEILVDAPVFTWMYMKQQGTNQTYKLKIVEVKGDESPENAMLKNKAFFEKEGIREQMFQYPTTAPQFEEDKKYVWGVFVNNMWSNYWWFTQRPKRPTCKNFKVDVVRKTTDNPDACCFDINISNNYAGPGMYRPTSFKVTARNSVITSASTAPSGWNKTPAVVPPNTVNIAWNRSTGTIPTGITNLGTICFGSVTSDPFYLVYEFYRDREKPVCRDSVRVQCRKNETGCNFEQGDNWFFGTNAGIKFDAATLVTSPLSGSAMNTVEGCAVTTDETTGAIRFYTDGNTIWNSNNLPMPNGSGLKGSFSSTQSAIIVPWSDGLSQKYYVFTVPAQNINPNDGLNYSVVDMSLNGGLGDVVPGEKNILLQALVSEKITAIPIQPCGSGYWLIAHGAGSVHGTEFYTYKVTTGTISPVPFAISSVGAPNTTWRTGQMKISPDGSKIAVAGFFDNYVEVFNFNMSNGVVGPCTLSLTNLNNHGGPYGIEFSPNSQYVFFTTTQGGWSQYLYRIDDLNGGNQNSGYAWTGGTGGLDRLFETTTSFGAYFFGSLQLGIDGKIYVARYNQTNLGVIPNPDEPVINNSSYMDLSQPIAGTCQLGLPTIIPCCNRINPH